MGEVKLVRDLMKVGVPTCSTDTPAKEIARRLMENSLEAVVVLDREGHAVGVIGQDELVRVYARGAGADLPAEAVMTEHVPQIPPDIPLAAAAQIMLDQNVRIMFLMHNADGIQYPAAMISYTHLLRHLVSDDDAELKDLGIRAERESPLAAFIRNRDAARRRASSSDSG